MSESAGKPDPEHAVTGERFMVVDQITQELITQQLTAALEQLDIIVSAIRADDEATSISLVYVRTVNARTYVDDVLKQLPWAALPFGKNTRAVIAPPPPD